MPFHIIHKQTVEKARLYGNPKRTLDVYELLMQSSLFSMLSSAVNDSRNDDASVTAMKTASEFILKVVPRIAKHVDGRHEEKYIVKGCYWFALFVCCMNVISMGNRKDALDACLTSMTGIKTNYGYPFDRSAYTCFMKLAAEIDAEDVSLSSDPLEVVDK